MNHDQLLERARQLGLPHHEVVAGLARSAVELEPDGDRGDALRLGGRPLLPIGLEWPRWSGRSLSLVAQLDLGACPPVPGLPEEGLLLAFYDAGEQTWGLEPDDLGSFRLVHVEAGREVSLRDWPDDLDDEHRFPARPLRPEAVLTLPPHESVAVEDLDLEGSALDLYLNLREELCGDRWAARALLGGYPDQIQGDIAMECALVAVAGGSSSAPAGEARAARRKESTVWRHVLQVPSDSEGGMMWGDAGCLYFMMREEDLTDREFDRAWLSLQCF